MNEKNKKETIISKLKDNKLHLINSYRDKLDIKYKRLHNIKTPIEKQSISKFFTKTSFMKNELNQTPIIKLNQTNSIFKNIKTNNISILDKNKYNSFFGIKKNQNKISSNFFLVKIKENEYLSPLNRNKNRGLFNSPSFSKISKTMREKILMNNSNNKFKQHFHNISYINHDKNRDNFINNFNKSVYQKNCMIRQKFFFHRNKSQKMLFNKSFQSFNKTSKNMNSNNKSISFSSIPIKELNSKISDKDEGFDLTLKRMHGIDIKIKELLKKNNKVNNEKDNEKKEKDDQIKKQKHLQQLARFYDNLPSIIIKKNIDKEFDKTCKKVKSKDFGQNFYSTIKILKKEENQKDEFDRLIQNNPVIKYIFLQNILNSLVHKVKLFGENDENLVMNSNTLTKLNGDIQDFITYGYEYIPENFLKNKNFDSPKDLIKDSDFINIILKTKSSIDNTMLTSAKEVSKLKTEFDIYTDAGLKIYSKNLKKTKNANIMYRFLEMQNKNGKMFNKSRFLYKRIHINKKENEKQLLNKSTNYDYSKIYNRSNNYSVDKTNNSKIVTNSNNNTNNDGNILSQLFNILYEDINNLDDIIKKDKKEIEKRNIIKNKEKFWRRLLQKNDNNEIIYYIPRKKRKIKSGKKSIKKINNFFNQSYEFEIIENRKIKSGKHYIEKTVEDDSYSQDLSNKSVENLRIKKVDYSSYNIYYKNKLKKDNNFSKKKPNINLIKKAGKEGQSLENIPETTDIFDSNFENKEKENNKNQNQKNRFYKKKLNVKSNQKKNKSREEYDLSKDKKSDSYYTSFNLEDILQKKTEKKEKNKGEKKEEQEKENQKEEKKDNDFNILEKHSFKDHLLRYHDYINSKKNAKILSDLIDSENTNKKRKKSIINLLNSKGEGEIKEAKKKDIKIIPKKRETQLFFSDVQGKSIEEVEKKKIELLYKFKHDIKYKIATGGINTEEMENFQEFQEKVNKLKNKFEDYDINLYIKEMEQFFQSFKNEMENSAKKKEDEDRINKYLRQFHEDCNVKQLYKDLQEKLLCKVINFSQINHINTLNESHDNPI